MLCGGFAALDDMARVDVDGSIGCEGRRDDVIKRADDRIGSAKIESCPIHANSGCGAGIGDGMA